MIHHGRSAPLFAIVTGLARAAAVEPGVIGIKAAIKTRSRNARRVQHLGSHKGGGRVVVLAEDVWKIGQILRNRSSEIAQMIELGISAGQNRGVRWRCEWNMSIGIFENQALT